MWTSTASCRVLRAPRALCTGKTCHAKASTLLQSQLMHAEMSAGAACTTSSCGHAGCSRPLSGSAAAFMTTRGQRMQHASKTRSTKLGRAYHCLGRRLGRQQWPSPGPAGACGSPLQSATTGQVAEHLGQTGSLGQTAVPENACCIPGHHAHLSSPHLATCKGSARCLWHETSLVKRPASPGCCGAVAAPGVRRPCAIQAPWNPPSDAPVASAASP